ncbi:MAG: hypothetical protein ACRDFS_11395 [Chloroflexota bacterium]
MKRLFTPIAALVLVAGMIAPVAGLGTSPVLAQAQQVVILQPGTTPTVRVTPGSTFQAQGHGFKANETINLVVRYPLSTGNTLDESHSINTDGQGAFGPVHFHVPYNPKPQTDTLQATGSSGDSASGSIVPHYNGSISVAPSSATHGQTVTVSGRGFAARTHVTVQASFPRFGAPNRFVRRVVAVGNAGRFSVKFPVPAAAKPGTVAVHAFARYQHLSTSLSIANVATSLAVSPNSVIPGTMVTAKGTGYPANRSVVVRIPLTLTNGATRTVRTTVTADSNGSFTASLKIPGNARGGSYTVYARSAFNGHQSSAALAVSHLKPSVVVVPTTAAPGTQVTVSGFGFAGASTVTIYLGGVKLGTATANGAGQFSTKITVPSSAAGGSTTLSAVASGGRKATISLTVARAVTTHFYFSAQYTGGGFHEYLDILNPTATRARVTISYLHTNGSVTTKNFNVNGRSRYTEDVNRDVGPNVSTAAEVSSDIPIVAARQVYFRNDGAVTSGVTSPSNVWYFANGNTGGPYRDFIGVENPNHSSVRVAVRFLPTHGHPFTVYRTMPPTSQTSFHVNSFVHHDAVGAVVRAGQPVVASRTMYAFKSMTSKIGVRSLHNSYYFAGGPSGNAPHWIGIINPSNHPISITLRAFAPDGALVGTKQQTLHPGARPGYETNKFAGRANVALVLRASAPLVAEQTSYVGAIHHAYTDNFGVPSTATTWDFASVNTGKGKGDLLHLFDPNSQPSPVVVEFIRANGRHFQEMYVVGPMQHLTVDVGRAAGSGQLGLVAASSVSFTALNRGMFHYGMGSDSSAGAGGR